MKVSVVIPCRNAEPWLAQTIGSALDQTAPPDEIIVIDDGSTDGSLALARRFEVRCGGRVRVHGERSGRASRTRNIGAWLAGGDALMFLDADDVLAPNALEALAGTLAGDPKGVAVCPWCRLERVDGRWVARPASCAPRRPGQDPLAAWLTGWYYPPCSVLWSRNAFRQVGGWDEQATVNDDGDLMMRALVDGVPLLESAEGLAFYRRLPHGQTSLSGTRFTPEGLSARLAVAARVARLLEERRRLGPYRRELAEAFGAIAGDAAGRDAALYAEARALGRRYGPPVAARLGRWARDRMGRLPQSHGTRPHPRRFPGPGEEIRCGLDRAAKVFAKGDCRPASQPAPASRPVVSVVVPTYRRPALLARALASVLGQSFGGFEALVIDDGPSDDTAAVVAAFGDPRLRYLPQPTNRGVAAARNRGLREACGDFIAFLDDDDEWLPDKLARQLSLFRAAPPEVGLVITGMETIEQDRRVTNTASARGDLYRQMLVRNVLHGGGSNIMIRRQVIAEVGGFDEAMAAIEDYDYWVRICRNYRVDCVPEPMARYYDERRPGHGETEEESRRSRKVAANLQARKDFYRKHGREMRRLGVAHLYLLDSVRRHLKGPPRDLPGARRIAIRAALIAPLSGAALKALADLVVPSRLKGLLRTAKGAVRAVGRG